MKKAALIVGARPQFIKTAPLILELGRFFQSVLIHTGQHYDFIMSDCFFDELRIPQPDYHLDLCGQSVGRQIARMIDGLESILAYEKPDLVIVVGDTNSTLAGAVIAAKMTLPLAHIEAGVRSQNNKLPEQINRVLTDSIADFFLCPSPGAVANLKTEGKSDHLYDCGDVIYDCLRLFTDRIPSRPAHLDQLPSRYVLATIHRAEAVDNRNNLAKLLHSIGTSPWPVIFPVHPRTMKMIQLFGLTEMVPRNILLIPPLGYTDILSLMKGSEYVVTDSGGVQREAVFLNKYVYVARPETEWSELKESGWLKISGYDFDLSTGVRQAPSGNADLAYLMRPAAAGMAEILSRL